MKNNKIAKDQSKDQLLCLDHFTTTHQWRIQTTKVLEMPVPLVIGAWVMVALVMDACHLHLH